MTISHPSLRAMFDLARSVRVEAACLNRYQRQQVDGIVTSIYEKVSRWECQTPDAPYVLNVETQLQQLDAMAHESTVELCQHIEAVVTESGDNIVQFGQTAYDSLAAVGYDCSSFDWTLDFAIEYAD